MLKDILKGFLILLIMVAFTTIMLPFTPYSLSLSEYIPLMNSETWINNVNINYNYFIILSFLILTVSSFALYRASKDN